MKNIHLLSMPSIDTIKNPGDLVRDQYGDIHIFTKNDGKEYGKTTTKLNIYITSDEEKQYPYALHIKKQEVLKINGIGENSKELFHDKGFNYQYECKKIILTTDQDLIKDGVQAIDDEFLVWFVKNPSCEEVFLTNDFEQVNQDNPILRGSTNVVQQYKIIIPKQEPKKVLTEEDIFNQKDIDAVTDYINKKQHYQYLIDMMKDDEELGLYDDTEINRTELICKDCSDSLQDCTCIEDTIDFPRQEIKLEEVFNDEKKENIKKFIDEINNPSQPNDKLKQAFKKYSEYLEDYENKNTYEHGFKDGAKWQQEQYTIEEQHVRHTIDELDKEYIKGFNEGSNYYIERMYSEEEVKTLLLDCRSENPIDVSKWFEQFKKK